MRFDEALGIDMRAAAALACVIQACVWLWRAHFGCTPSDLCCGALLLLCGCAAGLCHACWAFKCS